VPLALLGLLFGWLRERTGGLLVPLVVHALHNSLALGVCLAFPELMEAVYQ
jgi:membrane protease YdiL (CAAX protease family)